MNPMEKKKIRVKFPDKKKSPLKFKKEYIKTLQAREKSGWKFIDKHESKLSLLSEVVHDTSSMFEKRRHTIDIRKGSRLITKNQLNIESGVELYQSNIQSPKIKFSDYEDNTPTP